MSSGVGRLIMISTIIILQYTEVSYITVLQLLLDMKRFAPTGHWERACLAPDVM